LQGHLSNLEDQRQMGQRTPKFSSPPGREGLSALEEVGARKFLLPRALWIYATCPVTCVKLGLAAVSEEVVRTSPIPFRFLAPRPKSFLSLLGKSPKTPEAFPAPSGIQNFPGLPFSVYGRRLGEFLSLAFRDERSSQVECGNTYSMDRILHNLPIQGDYKIS